MSYDYSKLVGKLVVVAHWSDFKLEDATQLGIFEKFENHHFYIVGSNRGWRHCRRVSQKRIPDFEPCGFTNDGVEMSEMKSNW